MAAPLLAWSSGLWFEFYRLGVFSQLWWEFRKGQCVWTKVWPPWRVQRPPLSSSPAP